MALKWSTLGKIATNPKNIKTACATSVSITQNVKGKPETPKAAASFEDAFAVAKQLENLLKEREDLQEEVKQKLRSWKSYREEVIRCLRQLAEELHTLHYRVNASNLTGSVAGVAGGTATIAGLILAPFTMGASLALTVGGTVVGAAGGVVSLTASLSEMGITKSRCNEATEKVEEDNKKTDQLKHLIEKVQNVSVRLNKICQEKADVLDIVLNTISTGTTAASVGFAVKGVHTGVKTANAIKQNGEMAKKAMELTRLSKLVRSTEHASEVKNVKQLFQGSAATMSKTSRMVSGVFSVAFIGLDIWSIVTTSQDIHQGSKSEAGTKLQEKADALETEMKEIDKILKSILEN